MCIAEILSFIRRITSAILSNEQNHEYIFTVGQLLEKIQTDNFRAANHILKYNLYRRS